MAHQKRSDSGFALIEVLVSLVLVSVAMLLVLQLLVLDGRLQERRRAQAEVLEVLEAVIEVARGGGLPLESATLDADELALLLDRTLTHPMMLWWEVEPHAEVPELWSVRVRVRYTAARKTRWREVETRLWRPSP